MLSIQRFQLFLFILITCLALTWNEVECLTEISPLAPAIALDYKIHVEAGKEDCYYQYIMPGTVLYVDFQVVKGGDGNAGFAIKDPNGQFVLPYEWKSQSTYDSQSAMGGYYALCIDNQFSKFSAKLVSVYLNSYRAEDWTKYAEELESMQISVDNFTRTLAGVEGNIANVLQYLHFSRSKESRDSNILEDNEYMVQFWSLAQCVVIIGTGAFQIYFIKHLFDSAGGSGKTKVRT